MAGSFVAQYDFFPVGQGLFAAGFLAPDWGERPSFSWVYDCGTSSSPSLIQAAFSPLRAQLHGVRRRRLKIDLVAISHFDHDHISGLTELLHKFSIGTLLLPYMPIWQRLVIAFEEGVDTQQDLMRFFVNPAAYITGIEGARIDRIIFVPSSGEEGPPDDEGDVAPFSPEGDEGGELRIEKGDPPDDDARLDIEAIQRGSGTSVGFLREGGRALLPGRWEFVPYNDASLSWKTSARFIRRVRHLCDQLIKSPTKQERDTALVDVKDEYDRTFGKSARNRNVISLFLYSGPFRSLTRRNHFSHVRCFAHSFGRIRTWYSVRDLRSDRKAGILYTGDGYLNTRKRSDRLLNYLGRARSQRFCAVQVMHHGAEGNWHKGTANKLDPVVSVFSSDPGHASLGHPHAPVLRDFWCYCPVQVDKFCGVSIEIRLDALGRTRHRSHHTAV